MKYDNSRRTAAVKVLVDIPGLLLPSVQSPTDNTLNETSTQSDKRAQELSGRGFLPWFVRIATNMQFYS